MLNYDAGWDRHCERLEREEAKDEALRETEDNLDQQEETMSAKTKVEPTTAMLIAICVAGVVNVDNWRNRDTSSAQLQLAQAGALLKAGCDWSVAQSPKSDARTLWINITYPGFEHFDHDGGMEEELFYFPSETRLAECEGCDWY